MPAISSLGNLRGRAHGRASRDRRRTGQEKQTSACVVDCGVGVMSHTTRAHMHSKPQSRRMIRAEAACTAYLCRRIS